MHRSALPELPTGRNEELFPDLLDPVTAANDSLNTWLLHSRQQSESSTDDDEDDSSHGSSLTDYHSEEYENLPSLGSSHAKYDVANSSYPNKKPKCLEEDIHSEEEDYKDYEAEDHPGDPCCKAETQSSSQHQTDVFPESSYGEGDWIPILREGDRSIEDEDNSRCKVDRRCKVETLSSPQHKADLSSDCEYSYIPNSEYSIIPELEDWIGSWSVKDGKQQKGYHYINIYGFYKKTTKMGGFGVIVRDPCGKPVIASSYVQPKGVSFYYHVLQGVEAGLELALERGIYDLQLRCNSLTLDNSLRSIFQSAEFGLHGTGPAPYKCGACKTCLRYAIPLTDGEFEIMSPLLEKIIFKHSEIKRKSCNFSVKCVRSSINQAAYHLVKQHAKKTPLSAEAKTVTIEPEDFDDELKMIIYKDAYEGVRFYQQQQRLLQKKKISRCSEKVEKVWVD